MAPKRFVSTRAYNRLSERKQKDANVKTTSADRLSDSDSVLTEETDSHLNVSKNSEKAKTQTVASSCDSNTRRTKNKNSNGMSQPIATRSKENLRGRQVMIERKRSERIGRLKRNSLIYPEPLRKQYRKRTGSPNCLKPDKSVMAFPKGTFVYRLEDLDKNDGQQNYIWRVDNHQLLQKYFLDDTHTDNQSSDFTWYTKSDRYMGWFCNDDWNFVELKVAGRQNRDERVQIVNYPREVFQKAKLLAVQCQQKNFPTNFG